MGRARSAAGPRHRRPKRGASRRKRRSAPRQRPTLLLLHLDADRLRSDGLHLGAVAKFVARLSAIGLNAAVAVLDVTNKASLLRQFASLAETRRAFEVIVAVGHSDADGIKLVSDEEAVSWVAFANYLKPFRPRRLMLVACKAGQWPAAQRLFRTLPRLRRIYASPVNASFDLAQFMIGMVPYILGVRAPKARAVGWAQGAALALTGGQLREWKRTTDMGDPAGILLDFTAQAVDPYARQIPGLLRSFFR